MSDITVSELNNLKPITTAYVSFLKDMEDLFCKRVLSFCFFSHLKLVAVCYPFWMSGQKNRNGLTLYQPKMSSRVIVTFY